MTPLVSIIIPTYNRAHIIGETLDSIRAQSHTNWECLVIDDGSTDNTSEIMAAYIIEDNRFKYYSRPDDRLKGPCSCRNYGFEKSKGEFINFFDSDDLLKPEALEKALNSFNNQADAVIMNSVFTDLETGKLLNENKIQSSNLLTDYFICAVTFLVCGPLWKRKFLERQPYLFDEQIRNIDDWDFNLRMLYANPKLVFLDDVLIYYRIHPNSFSKEVRKLNKVELASDFAAREKHLHLIKSRNDLDKKELRNFILYRYKRYFKWAINQRADTDIKNFIFKNLLKQQIAFQDYWGVIKSCIGYFFIRLTGKGYVFFKD